MHFLRDTSFWAKISCLIIERFDIENLRRNLFREAVREKPKIVEILRKFNRKRIRNR